MRKASSGYFAFCKAHREGQRPRCPIRRCAGNEDVAPPVRLNPARSTTKWGCALRVVKRRPLFFTIQLSKINLEVPLAPLRVWGGFLESK